MKLKILLPTDFSKNSLYAIDYALELFKSDHCDFYLLNVFSVVGNLMKSLMNMEPGTELYENARAYSETRLAEVMDHLVLKNDISQNHHFHIISQYNSTIEAIKNVVDAKDIDMVVMGTKGETASRSIPYGSTAVDVMEKVRNCPVLVVPEKSKTLRPKEIVFPTNFKLAFKLRELKYLIHIAKTCDATIQIIYINEGELNKDQKSNKSLLEEYLKDVSFRFRELSHMHVPTAINCFAESRESDMLAFVNRKHLFFGSILSQALVKDIGYQSKIPVLVLHDLKN